MNKTLWQKLQPHVLAIAVFLMVSVFYCMPALKGLVVNQHDVLGWKGMAQQSIEFKEKHGHFPLWTNSLFSGMPAYQVSMESKYNITIAWLDYVFRFFLPSPASLFFLSCICFYILCCTLKLRTWVAVFGSLAYAFASYNAIIAAVGHTTKLSSMGYVPAILAGFILLTQRRYVLGFVSILLFSTLLFYQNHIQIVYYTLITVFCCAVAFAVHAIKQKQTRHVLVTGLLALAGSGISAGSYAVMLMPLNEYAKETIRGGRSELTLNKTSEQKTKGGLDKEYAFRYSYGIDETFTLTLPNFKGGSSGPSELGEDSKAVEAMQDAQLPNDAINYFYGNLSAYWGNQPPTSGPVYFGALVILLFIVGLFTVQGWHKHWLVAVSVLGIVLAWGSNLKGINYFLFDHLPLYNKFRAPSMALVIPQLSFALLAAMGLQEIVYGNLDRQLLWKKLKWAGVAVAALAVILIFTYFTADFKWSRDKDVRQFIGNTMTQVLSQGKQPTEQMSQQANGIASSITSAVVKDRKALYSADLLRTLVFFVLGAGLVWLSYKKKFQPIYISIAFCLLLLIDLIPVDLRYLNTKSYVTEDEFLEKFVPTAADLQIKQDTGYYRVFDQNGDFSDESRGAYHHNSIGGYHPAKLALYQDLIEHQLAKQNMHVFDMLNTKYFIISNPQNNQPAVIPNPGALGPAWFVKGIRFVNNADEEMKALDSLNTRDSAVADRREQSKIPLTPSFDSTATIRLIQNINDKITYESKSATPQLSVFSEIYYPYGWKAFVDGKETPIARVNYVLRAISLPAGNHSIEFRFEPESKAKGDIISLIIGILSWLLLLGGLFWEWKQSRKSATAPKT